MVGAAIPLQIVCVSSGVDDDDLLDANEQKCDLPPSAAVVVMESWEKLKLDNPDIGPLVGKLIFGKFFQVAPKANELFPAFFMNEDQDDANKQETSDGSSSSLILFGNDSRAFQLHSQKVVETFDYAVTSLMDLDRNILVDLGEKHISYLVKGKEDTNMPEFFAPLGEALLYALETGMQDYWDSALHEAWTLVINFIATSMTEGMHRGMAKRGMKRSQEQQQQQQEPRSEKAVMQTPGRSITTLKQALHDTERGDVKVSLDRTETCTGTALPSSPSSSSLSELAVDGDDDETPRATNWRQRFKQRTRELSCVFGVRPNGQPHGWEEE